MSLDAVATTALITLLGDVTWNLSLPCAATPAPHPRGSTVTVSKKLHPYEGPQQQAAPLAVHGVPLATSSFIISALAVQQLASIDSAAGAGVHTMQAALTIRRLRQMCDDGVNADSSSSSEGGSGAGGDEATCCDAGMNPTQWNIDVSSGGTANSDSITPPFVGTLVGNTILLVGLGVLRLCGCRLFDYLTKRGAFESCGPWLRQMLDTICAAFFSCSEVAVFWSTFSFLVSPTISASVGLMSAAVSPVTVVIGVFIGVAWLVPWGFAVKGVLFGKCPRPTSVPNTRLKKELQSSRRHHNAASRKVVMMMLLEPKEHVLLPHGTVGRDFEAMDLCSKHSVANMGCDFGTSTWNLALLL